MSYYYEKSVWKISNSFSHAWFWFHHEWEKNLISLKKELDLIIKIFFCNPECKWFLDVVYILLFLPCCDVLSNISMNNTVQPPNSRFLGPGIFRELEIRELEIHGFIRKILLIHGFIRKNPSNSLFFLIIQQWIGREFVN